MTKRKGGTTEAQIDKRARASVGLYVTDAAIAQRLGFSQKTGYRIIRQLDMPNRARRPYPARDPLFGGRRFWPAVLQWHMDYHHVRTERAQIEQPMWEETFS